MKTITIILSIILLFISCKDGKNKSHNTTEQEDEFETNLLSLKNMDRHHAFASKVDYLGREAIKVEADPNHKSIEEGGCDNCTFVMLDKTNFKNGTIEIDVAGKPGKNAGEYNRGFVGVVFRINESQTHYEGFYLRPDNAKSEQRKYHTFQYFSAPDYPWHVLREKYPNTYEGYADVETGEWQTLKIDVQGSSAVFFVNDKKVLEVNKLFQGEITGKIGLFTEPNVDAYFSNLKIESTN